MTVRQYQSEKSVALCLMMTANAKTKKQKTPRPPPTTSPRIVHAQRHPPLVASPSNHKQHRSASYCYNKSILLHQQHTVATTAYCCNDSILLQRQQHTAATKAYCCHNRIHTAGTTCIHTYCNNRIRTAVNRENTQKERFASQSVFPPNRASRPPSYRNPAEKQSTDQQTNTTHRAPETSKR